MALLRQLRQTLPHIGADGEALCLGHGSLSVPAADRDQLPRQRNLDERVVAAAIDHLRALDQRPVPLVEFEQFPALLATANIDPPIHAALQDGAEVAERMLYVAQVNGLRGKVLQIVHDDLLSVRHEHGYPVVVAVLLERPFCLQDLGLNLLEGGQINLVENLLLQLFEVLLFESDLFAHLCDFFLKAVNLLFVDADRLLRSRAGRGSSVRLSDLIAACLVRVGRPQPLLSISAQAVLVNDLLVRVSRQVSLLDGVLDALKEVDNLVLDEVLVDFHLALEIPHLCLVDELQDPGGCVFDGPDILFFQSQYLRSYVRFELPIGGVDDISPLLVQHASFLLDEVETLLIAAQEAREEVEAMACMQLPRAEAV